MKKIFLFAFACCVGLASIAGAAFVDKTSGPQTVAGVKDLKDDTPVQLKGKITENLGDEKYSFTDETGTIVVEIDNEDWRGQDVNATDTVIITGEVDKGFFTTEVDVDTVQIVK